MTKKLSAISLLLTLQLLCLAQNSIQGHITSDKGESLIGATVYFPEISKGTSTDAKGYYEIRNIPQKDFKIEVSYIGYHPHIDQVSIGHGTTTYDASLSSAILSTQEVVVSGGYTNSQHENTLKIEVLKAKELHSNGHASLMESLTLIPGVDMISKGQGVSKPVIRGLSMNNILVMNNGVRIENYQFGENHPLGVDENAVEQVEIIKGPASLLYGSDAIGGVLNFVKEKPADLGKTEAYLRSQFHSNTLGNNTFAGIKSSKKNFFGGINLGNKTHADYLQGGGKYVPNSRFNEKSLATNLGHTGKLGVFKLNYDYFQQQLGLSVPAAIANIDRRERSNDIWYQDLDHHLISTKNKLYLGTIRWSLNGSYQNAMRQLKTTSAIPEIEMHLQTLAYDTKVYLPEILGADVVLGLQGYQQYNRNLNDRIEQILPDADVSNIALVSLIELPLGNHIKWQGGLRYDWFHTHSFEMEHHEEHGDEDEEHHIPELDKRLSNLTGSIGLTYIPHEHFHFRANVANGYRMPRLSELTAQGAHGVRDERGNANLKAQNAYETDLSLHYHGELLSFDVAGFYNIIDNYIYLAASNTNNDEGIPIYNYTQSNATLYGSENGIHFHPGLSPWLHIQANYSFVIGKQDNGNYLPFIPAHKLRYEIRAEKEKWGKLSHSAIKLSALTASKQDRPSPNETASKGYTVVNLGLSTALELKNQAIELSFNINNLLDKAYIDHLSTLKPLGYTMQGRNVVMSINLPLEF